MTTMKATLNTKHAVNVELAAPTEQMHSYCIVCFPARHTLRMREEHVRVCKQSEMQRGYYVSPRTGSFFRNCAPCTTMKNVSSIFRELL